MTTIMEDKMTMGARESQLLPIILNQGHKFGEGLSKSFEISSGFGIADIIFYSLNPQIVKKRIQQNLNPITSYDIMRILTSLNNISTDVLSLTLLKETFPSIRKNKDEILSFLIKNDFLIPENKTATEFKKGNSYKVGLQEVIAIEAKLSNWQRGLYQAYRYRQYANKSYLALYSKYIHRALKQKEDFIKCNVGLIEVRNNSIEIHIEPKKEKLKENIYSALIYENLLSVKNLFPNIQETSPTFIA